MIKFKYRFTIILCTLLTVLSHTNFMMKQMVLQADSSESNCGGLSDWVELPNTGGTLSSG